MYSFSIYFLLLFTPLKVFISTQFQFSTIGNKITIFIVYFVSLLGVAYGAFAISLIECCKTHHSTDYPSLP